MDEKWDGLSGLQPLSPEQITLCQPWNTNSQLAPPSLSFVFYRSDFPALAALLFFFTHVYLHGRIP
jgi:hypothetical protein